MKKKLISVEKLQDARFNLKLFTVDEIATMFRCGRGSIDNALNSGELLYISPNHRERFVYVSDFENYLKTHKREE